LAAARLYLVCPQISDWPSSDRPWREGRGDTNDIAGLMRAAIAGGVDIVQVRDKHLSDEELLAIAHAARALCERLGALLIVNDRPVVALEAGADGVHVGQDDMPVAEVRALVGSEMLIGLSTHTPQEIDAAAGSAPGAEAPSVESESGPSFPRSGLPHRDAWPSRPDYIGVGPVHETPTKPGRQAVGLDLVRYATAHAPVPFFAIGGLDAENLAETIDAGARRAVVLRAIADADDPQRAARVLRNLLDARPLEH
jgi:thiamine-phosphate pyrophosphorylase